MGYVHRAIYDPRPEGLWADVVCGLRVDEPTWAGRYTKAVGRVTCPGCLLVHLVYHRHGEAHTLCGQVACGGMRRTQGIENVTCPRCLDRAVEDVVRALSGEAADFRTILQTPGVRQVPR